MPWGTEGYLWISTKQKPRYKNGQESDDEADDQDDAAETSEKSRKRRASNKKNKKKKKKTKVASKKAKPAPRKTNSDVSEDAGKPKASKPAFCKGAPVGNYAPGDYAAARKQYIEQNMKWYEVKYKEASDWWNQSDERWQLLKDMPRNEAVRRRFISKNDAWPPV